MKKLFVMLSVAVNCVLTANIAFCQNLANSNNFDLKKILPTSPEAAMLGRFGDIPISYYTGTADVSVPMYSFKVGTAEIPIVLRYHGSGIKVDDEATNAGLGWSLEPGGSIIKIINGAEDPVDGDPLPFRDATGYAFLKSHRIEGVYSERPVLDLWPCRTTHSGDSFDLFNFLEMNEGQPDMFQYSFGNYSGKFFIHPETHEIVLTDKRTDIQFSHIAGGGWIAKTLDGTTFTFNVREWATSGYMTETASETFKLKKIESPNGKIITFDYVSGFYRSASYNETYHSEYPLNGGQGEYSIMPNTSYPMHYTQTLKRITGDHVIVDFNLEDREDLDVANGDGIAGMKRIVSVDIKDAQTLQRRKSFVLSHSYFGSSIVGGSFKPNPNPNSPDGKRLKLLSVQEIGYTNDIQQSANPPYLFSYDESLQLPLKSSFARDFWGYYNGKENSKMIPDLSFFYYSGDPDYSYIAQDDINAIWGHNGSYTSIGTASPNTFSSIINNLQGANRAPDSTKMRVASLKSITYPTGGSTEFFYQPNSFNNHVYPDVERTVASAQHKYVTDNNTIDYIGNGGRSYVFSLSNSQNVNFNNIITRGPNDAVSFWDMQPSTITLTKTVAGVTSVIKTWQMSYGSGDNVTFDNAGGTMTWNESVNLPYIAGAQYTITANLADALGEQGAFPKYASVSSNFSYEDIPAGSLGSSYGGGLRISSIKNFESAGQVTSLKMISYLNTDNVTSGKLMSPIKPLYVRRMNAMKNVGDYSDGTVDVNVRTSDVWFISSESSVPISSSAGGNPIGYSRVEETELAPNGGTNGRHVYSYYNVESDARPNVPENPYGLNGMLSKEEIYSNTSATALLETNYTYFNKQTSSFSGFKLLPANIGGGCTTYMVPPDQYVYKWMVVSYPILSNWYLLQNKQTKQNFNGNFIITNESYAYNTKGQMISTSATDSRNRINTSSFLYPADNPSDPTARMLINQGLYDNLLEQKSTIAGVETTRSNIEYRLENGLAVESAITRTNQGANTFSDVTFDKYGPFNTLQQFTKNGPPSCLIWSYASTRPIAEIKNITFSMLATLLGGEEAVNAFSALISPTKVQIDNFLAPLSGYFVTRYAYDPLTGLTSQTAPNGVTTYYDYDEMFRLKNIRDQNSNIIKNFKYNYHQ